MGRVCRPGRHSTAGTLYRPAVLGQLFDQSIPVIALDLDGVILDRAAGTALLLQGFGKVPELVSDQGHSRNDGDPFPFPAFGRPADTYDAVLRGPGGLASRISTRRPALSAFSALGASAVGRRPSALRTHFSVPGGVDEAVFIGASGGTHGDFQGLSSEP